MSIFAILSEEVLQSLINLRNFKLQKLACKINLEFNVDDVNEAMKTLKNNVNI